MHHQFKGTSHHLSRVRNIPLKIYATPDKPFVWSLHPPSHPLPLHGSACLHLVYSRLYICRLRRHQQGLRSLLGYDSTRGVSRGVRRVEGERLWTNPPRVPSLLQGTYLTKPRMHGPRELQPLCMIIENPRDTSQPHSRVIYYYFVSITSERTSRVGWVSIYSWQYFDELCWLILAQPKNEILLGFRNGWRKNV